MYKAFELKAKIAGYCLKFSFKCFLQILKIFNREHKQMNTYVFENINDMADPNKEWSPAKNEGKEAIVVWPNYRCGHISRHSSICKEFLETRTLQGTVKWKSRQGGYDWTMSKTGHGCPLVISSTELKTGPCGEGWWLKGLCACPQWLSRSRDWWR